MKNKLLSFAAIMSILMPNTFVFAQETSDFYTNSNGINMSDTQFRNLQSLGYTDEQILYMEQDEFSKNDNLSGDIVSTDVKYVKTTYVYKAKDESMSTFELNRYISTVDDLYSDDNLKLISVDSKTITEEEYNEITEQTQTDIVTNDVNPDIISTDYKKLTTQIIKLSNGRYRFRNDLTWKKMPSNRSYDLFAIAVNNSVAEPVSGTHYARLDYKTKDSCTLTTTAYQTTYASTTNWKRGSQGYGVSMLLPSNTTKTYTWDEFLGTSYPCATGSANDTRGHVTAKIEVTSLSAYMYYDVAKVGATSPLSAYGTYQHSVKSISLSTSLDFSVSVDGTLGGAISITPTISEKFDGMAGTHAQLLNPSW